MKNQNTSIFDNATTETLESLPITVTSAYGNKVMSADRHTINPFLERMFGKEL